MCHVVHDEYNGGRVSCCTRRVYWSCVMFYTTNIVVVVCHVVHDEYTDGVCHVLHDEYSGGRVSCCTRRV